MNITFRGREVEVEQLAEGVAKKTENIYYVRCIKTGDWLYACKSRFDKLVEKAGSVEDLGKTHLGRPGKKQVKAELAQAQAAVPAVQPEAQPTTESLPVSA